MDMSIVARNVSMLLLLAIEDVQVSADTIIHLWYSSRMKPSHIASIETHVLSIVNDVVSKITSKVKSTLHAKTVVLGKAHIRIILTKKEWTIMQSILSRNVDSKAAEKSRRDIVLAREDYVDRSLNLVRNGLHRRLCMLRFRERGILLPFGSSSAEYTQVNPYVVNLHLLVLPHCLYCSSTLVDQDGDWMQKDSADPLEGWALADFSNFCEQESSQHKLTNDLYGQLNYYLRYKLSVIHQKLRNQTIDFTFHCLNATRLKDFTPLETMDRIEVSNIIDLAYLGIDGTLDAVRPLLRRRNKHATIVGLFMNAIHLIEQKQKDNQDLTMPMMVKAMGYLGIPTMAIREVVEDMSNPKTLQLAEARAIFSPFDKWYKEYEDEQQILRLSHHQGLRLKKVHTIIPKWPFRLEKRLGDPGAQEEFDELLASGSSGFERYMEWTWA